MGPFPLLKRVREEKITNPADIISHPLSYPTPLNVRVKLLQRNLFCVNGSIYGNKQLQPAECKGDRRLKKKVGGRSCAGRVEPVHKLDPKVAAISL
jgi:hypothetical protein